MKFQFIILWMDPWMLNDFKLMISLFLLITISIFYSQNVEVIYKVRFYMKFFGIFTFGRWKGG